jgi:hypothetical protein
MINLEKDFQDIVIKYGEEKGLIFSDRDRKQAVIRILNFYRKIGIGNKKVISYARNIKIPKKFQKRVESVLKHLSKGGDITPYLSTQSINLDRQQDLMFNDWNILHIHLGKKPHINNPRFIERTGELLFLLYTVNEIRVLGLFHHNPPSWSRQELLQTIYDNWPEMLSVFHEAQLEVNFNDYQRGELRKSHLNVIDEVYDKKKQKKVCVMTTATMGITCSGESSIDVMTYIKVCRILRDIEKNILQTNLLSEAKLYESDGVWAVIDNNLQKFYWSGGLVKLIR